MPANETPEELLASLDRRLRTERGVDLGLAGDLERFRGRAPGQALDEARELLVGRVPSLQQALVDVSAAIQELREIQQLLRFTEVGWPERRQELERLCSEDPVGGLAQWLNDWFQAASSMRLDACRRHLTMQLPQGAEVLVRRCRATTAALETLDSWEVASPLLVAGARGIEIEWETVPEVETRHRLWVLLVRLAEALGRPDDARRTLDEARVASGGPLLDVLAARLLDTADPTATADSASAGASTPDVLLEVARTRSILRTGVVTDLGTDRPMIAARKAVAAARSIGEAEQLVVQLLPPVPPEIHLAVAERAATEGDDDAALRALDQALARAEGAVAAKAHESLATVLRTSDVARACREYVAAAEAWASVSRWERAQHDAEAALALDEGNLDAHLALANCLTQLHWMTPVAEGRAEGIRDQAGLRQLRRALASTSRVVDLSRVDGEAAERRLSWALYLRGRLNGRLALFEPGPSTPLLWASLRDALESIVVQPGDWSCWGGLADAAYDLELWSLAELAAGEAARVAPDSRDALAEHVRALINRGDYGPALELLGEPTTSYEWNMKAHVLLRQGDAPAAAALLDEHAADTDLLWARLDKSMALLLVGRDHDALAVAKDLDSWLRPRDGQSDTWEAAARTSLMLGDDDRVRRMAEKLRARGEHGANVDLAILACVEDDVERATALVVEYVEAMNSTDGLVSWENIERPFLVRTLTRREAPAPDLSTAQVRAEALLRELARRRDPHTELDHAVSTTSAPADADGIRLLGSFVVALAWHRPPDAQLSPSAQGQWLLGPRGPRRATEVVAAAQAGSSQTVELVRQLLHDYPGTADDLLRAAAPEGVPEQVGAALVSLSTDPEVGSRAVFTAGWLGLRTAADASPDALQADALRVQLPESWFATYSDPTADHPLFVRHLREMRMLTGQQVPPVRVAAEPEHEPDRYRILRHDVVVEEGSLPTGRRLLPEGAMELGVAGSQAESRQPAHGEQPAQTGQPEEDLGALGLGTVAIRDVADAEGTWAGLLSRSALEVLVARIELLSAALTNDGRPTGSGDG